MGLTNVIVQEERLHTEAGRIVHEDGETQTGFHK